MSCFYHQFLLQVEQGRFFCPYKVKSGFPGGSALKNPSASAGDVRDSIPGLGISPGGGMATHPSIVDWRIPWTEDPGWLQSMGPEELDMTDE